eukprot:comp60764_c0_seq1/m.47874 comp60764_c0_seq1/g.47874  ORF comp60764_c0_seq1/g.47874 comp60764_c0_seq1/m.47874 type:complete len:230 (-) comp60764_c0_seq1:81-770(-)
MKRVLCFHGFKQNGKILREKTTALRRTLRENGIELLYVDGPHIDKTDYSTDSTRSILDPPPSPSPKTNTFCSEENHERVWWRAKENGTVYNGYPETLDYLKNVLETHGPIHGVLGYSQGAMVAYVLCALAGSEPGRLPNLESMKTAVFIGGGLPRATIMHHWVQLERPWAHVHSLHVWGDQDTVVPTTRSEKLAGNFVHASTHNFQGSHIVPSDKASVETITAFLASHV